MVRQSFIVLIFLVVGCGVNARPIEFVDMSRVYTPTPVFPSMMEFSTKYMLENDGFEINAFAFYHSYARSVRLFTVDAIAFQEYRLQKEECSPGKGGKPGTKELSTCGRVVAALYMDSHSMSPKFYGFESVSMEVVPRFRDGVFYFTMDGKNVLFHQADHFGLKKNKRYLIKANLSPYGDYDLREVNLQFGYEAYLSGAELVQRVKGDRFK